MVTTVIRRFGRVVQRGYLRFGFRYGRASDVRNVQLSVSQLKTQSDARRKKLGEFKVAAAEAWLATGSISTGYSLVSELKNEVT